MGPENENTHRQAEQVQANFIAQFHIILNRAATIKGFAEAEEGELIKRTEGLTGEALAKRRESIARRKARTFRAADQQMLEKMTELHEVRAESLKKLGIGDGIALIDLVPGTNLPQS